MIGCKRKCEYWQTEGRIPTIEQHIELKTTVYQPISKSQSSIRTSRQSLLLYGAETWRTTTTTIKKIQVFINGYLHKVLNIHCSDTTSNRLV
ncbi:unnamed protein product [Schistosoma curassoni]|uniref:Ovule protein n=1 Tax=Schistosoma curassoni TaxID=6186 RepID=A0A183JWC1_9TREM|nr:unnamed protein product [Schistosoma curassoni]